MIRVGILGRGMATQIFHAPLIGAVTSFQIVRIAGSADAQALLSSEDIDLVVIATPNVTHFSLARAALQSGKHVVVDKPLTLSVDEGQALIALAALKKKILTVFHNRRWDGDFLTVRQVFESSALGTVSLYESYWDRFRPGLKESWKESSGAGTGILWDLGPHLIDQALLLLGQPEAVTAEIAAQRNGAMADDCFKLTLHYGQRRAILGASMLMPNPRPRFSIHGSAASLIKYGLDPQEAALKQGESPLSAGFGEDEVDRYARLGETAVPTQRGRHLEFYHLLAVAIETGAPPPVDPTDALRTVRLIEDARRSAARGRLS